MKAKIPLVVVGSMMAWLVAAPARGVEVSEQLKVAGFAIAQYAEVDKAGSEDDRSWAEIHPLYLSFDFHPTPPWRALVETEYEHLPALAGDSGSDTPDSGRGEILLQRAYIEYSHNDLINIQAGKFFTPAGLFMATHWRLLTPSYERPIYFENRTFYLPSHQVGLHYFGQHQFGDSDWETRCDAWWTQGASSQGSDSPEADFDNPGANLRMNYRDWLSFGMAYQGLNATEAFDRNQNSVLAFAQFRPFGERLILSSEYVTTQLDAAFANTNAFEDVQAVYMGAEYKFAPKWSVYYRYDVGDDMKRSGVTVPTAETNPQATIHTLAFSWEPAAGTKISVEYNDNNFEEGTDYSKFMVYIGQLF